MAESVPRRRRLRAQLLTGLERVPAPVLGGALRGLAGAARFSRFEALALENLELALGAETTPRERQRIARGVRRHAARIAGEWVRLARGGRSERERAALLRWLDGMVECDASVERLEHERRAGRGLIVCTAHIGNWELLAATLRRRGFAGAVLGARKRRDPAAEWLVAMRRAYGVESLPQRIAPRRLIERLRSGETLGLLCDLEVRRVAGAWLPFFGVPALTMTAPAGLARAARLPLFPARCVLHGERYRLIVDEPLELDPALPRREAALDLMTRVNAVFERWIRADPAQWAWHQPRWRTRTGERYALPLAGRPQAPAAS